MEKVDNNVHGSRCSCSSRDVIYQFYDQLFDIEEALTIVGERMNAFVAEFKMAEGENVIDIGKWRDNVVEMRAQVKVAFRQPPFDGTYDDDDAA